MGKIKTKCDKCGTDCIKAGTFFTEGGQVFYFCLLCSSFLQQIDGCQRVYLFLQDDFLDKFKGDISPETRNMILARVNRKKGIGPWSDKK